MAVRSRLLPVTTEPSQYASFRPEAARWGKTRQAAAPARFFTVSGYAPFSVQTMLLRYFAFNRERRARHGEKDYIRSMIAFSVALGRIAATHLSSSGK
jgi:hypothetical protein